MKKGEIGANSESVAALNLPIGKLFRALRVSRAALGGKKGEIGPNSESVAALNLPIGKLFRALRVSRAAFERGLPAAAGSTGW